MHSSQIESRVREIVGRHKLPDFVTGFDIRVGEFDGDPALWVVFKMTPGPQWLNEEALRRVEGIAAVRESVQPDLLEAFSDRFPYFKFEEIEEAGASN